MPEFIMLAMLVGLGMLIWDCVEVGRNDAALLYGRYPPPAKTGPAGGDSASVSVQANVATLLRALLCGIDVGTSPSGDDSPNSRAMGQSPWRRSGALARTTATGT